MNLPIPNERPGIARWLRKYPGDAVILGIILVVATIFFGYVWPFFRVIWSFDRIEQKAKRRITAPELQAWATNLLAQQPLGQHRYRVADLGTNFPQQLTGLWKRPPDVIIYNSGPGHINWVRVTWGSGGLGHCGFNIGATSSLLYSINRKNSHEWSDGVYFYKD